MKLLIQPEGGIFMLEKNIKMETLIKFLDAKARMTIWITNTEKIFEGYVYQLYDVKNYNDMYVSNLSFSTISGISVLITKEYL